jgi:hypothetical protein
MKVLYILVLITMAQTLSAQSHDNHVHSDKHKNEVGIANSPIYIIREKEFAYGLHAHYIRSIKETRFGIGVGYERVFDDHKHNTIAAVLSFTPIEHLSLSLSPGITFRDKNASDMQFGLHLETLYEFEIGFFHVGPVAEFAYYVEDYHVSIGVHVGFGF